MFIEKLWIIEKVVVAVGMSQSLTKNNKRKKKTWTGNLLSSDAHAQAHALLIKSGRRTHSNAQDETVITVSTKLILT